MADKLKLCIIAPTIPPAYGGGGRRMYNQARYIASLGHKVTIITNTPNSTPQIDNLNIELIKLPVWYQKKNNNNKFIRFVKRIIYQPVIVCMLLQLLKKKHFDVVHLVNSVTRLSLYAVLISKLKGLKIINSTTLYGSDDPVTIKKTRGKTSFYVFFHLTDAIVNNSPLLTEKCKEGGVSLQKIHFIPNPVDTVFFMPPKNLKEKHLLKRKHNVDNFRCVFLTASIVSPRKNIDMLIKVFKKVHVVENNICLLIAGPYSLDKEGRRYYKQQKTLVAQLGLDKNIFFLGQSDITNELMQASDIFVFASEREGCPNVVLEALSSGLPVVMKKIDKVSNNIITNNNGFVVESADDFSKKLIELINNTKQLKDTSAKARSSAVEKFAYKPIMDRYIELYRKVGGY